MSRSSWKSPYIQFTFLKKVKKKLENLKIWSRNSVIPSSLIEKAVLVHTGKEFKNLYIFRERVGYTFGDFCVTRSYSLNVKKPKNKKK